MSLFAIYLNDHLALQTAGLALARRARQNNAGSPLGEYLEQLTEELERDHRELESLMQGLGVRRSRWKPLLARVAERAGRVKLNGRIFGYSRLSRLVELEGLCAEADARRNLWRAVEAVGPDDERVREVTAALSERAGRQRADLEHFRLEAARRALGAQGEGAAQVPSTAYH